MSDKKAAATSETNSGPATLARAVSLHLEGRTQEALEQLRGMADSGEATVELFLAKAQMEFELDQFEEAAQSYARVLGLNPRHGQANFNIAVCLERLGRWEGAGEYFEQALEAE